MREEMERWLASHPDATVADAFRAGWFECTSAWCHGKREQMEQVRDMISEILSK